MHDLRIAFVKIVTKLKNKKTVNEMFTVFLICRREDSNFHALAGTSPSSWRVCHFATATWCEDFPDGNLPNFEDQTSEALRPKSCHHKA